MNNKIGPARRIDQGPKKARVIEAWPGIKDGDLVKFRKTIGRQTREDFGIISLEAEAPSNSYIFV